MKKAGLVPNAIHGFCDYRFRAVKEAFVANFDQQLEVGAGVAIEVEGRRVVDLWAGSMDAGGNRPWQPDTLVNLYSATKGLVSVCANRLVDQGLLDMDAPVSRYWPEFACARKGQILVRYLLSHRAGLPAIRQPLEPGAYLDWDLMTDLLAKSETWWEPGTRHGYHVLTFGWLVGEVIRRVVRQSLGAYLRENITGPFDIDLFLGLPESEEGRVAPIVSRPHDVAKQGGPLIELLKDKESMTYKAMLNPRDATAVAAVNTRAWRAAEIPAANAMGNARALARLYSILATSGPTDGPPLLEPDTLAAAVTTQAEGMDAVLGVETRFGLGFALNGGSTYYGPNRRAFGHPGLGGSTGFADPDAKLGFGYAMNQLVGTIDTCDLRRQRLIDAAYGSM